MLTSYLLFLLTAIYFVLADDTSLKNELYDAFGGPGSGMPRPPGLPEHPPKRVWIFDDLPLLMTWTLAYIACGVTFVLWLTGYTLRQWEAAVDRDDKDDEPDQNEEEVGLFRNAYDKDTVRHRGNDYGAVLQSSAEPRI
ncbi:hypothetical protein BJV82DRAFT_666455 [Fennellomyces sp. T-0311]|nr:hypothetical protein BJV82DRAFT_666455 [Fennellomyces sp. T-0311]